MADRDRLAAAGFFLALTLAAIPALLPVRFAGAAAAHSETVRPLVELRAGSLPVPVAPEPEPLRAVAVPAPAPLAARSRSIAPGDTLWKISSEAGVSVEALAAANRLSVGATLRPGQLLTIPSGEPGVSRAPQATHEVVAGDSLWSISRALGVAPDVLAAANHLSPDQVLHLGQRLALPAVDRTARWLYTPPARTGNGGLLRRPTGRAATAPPSAVADLRSLQEPSEGLITSRFGWRMHPIFGTREFHTGLDIANRIGTPIRAAESGIVRFVGWMGGYGRLIIVAHPNGLETSYSHLSSMLVGLGQRVVRGDLLGRMGSTGWSTGPHLFFEVRRNGVPLDPMPLLQGQKGILVQPRAGGAPVVRPAARPSAPPAPGPHVTTLGTAPAAPPALASAPSAAGDASAPVSPSKEHRVLTEQDPEPSSVSPEP